MLIEPNDFIHITAAIHHEAGRQMLVSVSYLLQQKSVKGG